MSFLVFPRRFPTSLSFFGGSRAVKKWSVMNGNELVLYGNPTPSDLDFMIEDENPSFSSSTSSTRSDAQSAPPECERIFDRISDECAECAVRADKQLPPEWNMPDLVRTVIGDDEAIHMPSFLTNSYYDVMLHGSNSWLCQEVFQFMDLINYVF